MEKGAIKLVIFNGEDFSYWKNRNSQLSSEPGPYHMGDHAGGIRDPDDTRQRDLR
jgi:hypothetical protein